MSAGARRPEVIRSWRARAGAYLALTRRWPLFARLADRLVDALPPGFAGHAVDLGGGAGLVSRRILARHPAARVTLVDPAPEMIALAEREAAGLSLETRCARAEDLGAVRPPLDPADAILASAVMHLCDEEAVLAAAARALAPGGVLAFNLWGHSYDELCADPAPDWREPIERALAELELPATEWPATPPPRVRERRRLVEMAAASGLTLTGHVLDADEVSASFFVDFAAMSSSLLGALAAEERAAVLARAEAIAAAPITVRTARLTFARRAP